MVLSYWAYLISMVTDRTLALVISSAILPTRWVSYLSMLAWISEFASGRSAKVIDCLIFDAARCCLDRSSPLLWGSLTSWLSQYSVGDAAVKTAVASFCRTVVPTFLDHYPTTDPSLQGKHFLCLVYSHYHVSVRIFSQGSSERLGDEESSGVLM